MIGLLVALAALAQEVESVPEASEPEAEEEAAAPDAEEEARLAALEARLAELEEALDAQRKESARQRLAAIPEDLRLDLEGHYRTRGYLFPDLFHEQEGSAAFLEHRLRLRPVASYKELAKLSLEIDALDDVVWGDNASLASTALFAGDPSTTGPEGRTLPSVTLNRAWVEVRLPVGQLSVGRMPSHWGLGLLSNNGDGFDDTFGDNHDGSTFDRILFATRPLAIVDALRGVEDREIPLFVAVGVDRLVEDPLVQYHGYRCEPGVPVQDESFDPRCDRNGDGLTDADHGYTDDTFTEDSRRDGWWADSADDVMEMVYVVIYRGEEIGLFGTEADLTAGTYIVHRVQDETDSQVLIVDGYLDARVRGLLLQAEAVHIGGRTRAITLPGAVGSGDDPLFKQADIWGYAVRAGYARQGYEVVVEHGYASGDDNVADQDFTGRPAHRDYNVGLLLYEEVISRVTAGVWTEAAEGLWSRGGVYNSRYVFPTAHLYPLDNWELLAGFLAAWPDEADGAVIRESGAALLGWEVDVGLKHRWHEHMVFSLEGGFARATDRLPLELVGLDPSGTFWTVQSRIGWEF